MKNFHRTKSGGFAKFLSETPGYSLEFSNQTKRSDKKRSWFFHASHPERCLSKEIWDMKIEEITIENFQTRIESKFQNDDLNLRNATHHVRWWGKGENNEKRKRQRESLNFSSVYVKSFRAANHKLFKSLFSFHFSQELLWWRCQKMSWLSVDTKVLTFSADKYQFCFHDVLFARGTILKTNLSSLRLTIEIYEFLNFLLLSE